MNSVSSLEMYPGNTAKFQFFLEMIKKVFEGDGASFLASPVCNCFLPVTPLSCQVLPAPV